MTATREPDVAIVGLGVMGRGLALNLADAGHGVVGHSIEPDEVEAVVRDSRGRVRGAHSLGEAVSSLTPTRVIWLMVPAGPAVDSVLEDVCELLSPGDIVIDGGNSRFADTERRVAWARERDIRFIGLGVSGGADGARNGASLMPGGDPDAWEILQPLLESVAAKAPDGTPCVTWIGPGGSGHFVKTVHNGIEYALMQAIAEAYDVMFRGMRMTRDEVATVFESWADGGTGSFLVEASARVLRTEHGDGPLLELIRDEAGHNGTGQWALAEALQLGTSATLMAGAVFARMISSDRSRRDQIVRAIPAETWSMRPMPIHRLEAALYTTSLVAFAQGFDLMAAASHQHGWSLRLRDIARIWRNGCVIRSNLLEGVELVYANNPTTVSIVSSEKFAHSIRQAVPSLRRAVAEASMSGLPVPTMSSALSYLDTYGTGRLPTALIQAQRDYFGSHGFERVDRSRGEIHHHRWRDETSE